MRIVLKDDIKNIASRTAFSYREIYALSMLEDFDHIEAVVQAIAISGMSVGMYLMHKGIPQKTVYKLLHEEAQYVREGDAGGNSICTML